MLFDKYLKKATPIESTKKCKLIPSSSPLAINIPFSSHIIYLDKLNQIGIEYNWNIRIRIDGIYATDYGTFKKMMATLIDVSKSQGYKRLFFANSITDDVLDMLLSYGFREIPVLPDSCNRYLTYDIDGYVCA